MLHPSHLNRFHLHLKKPVYAPKQKTRTTSLCCHFCHRNHSCQRLPKSWIIRHLDIPHSKETQSSHPNIWMPSKQANGNVNIVVILQKNTTPKFSIDVFISRYTYSIHTYVPYINKILVKYILKYVQNLLINPN